MKTLTIVMLAILANTGLFAQIPGHDTPPRTDDHFHRNLVVNRIDLAEKLNEPMVRPLDGSLYSQSTYGESQGIISALISGFRSGKYLAYDSDSLNKSLTYEEVLAVMKRIQGDNEEEDWPEEADNIWNEEESWESDEWDSNEWGEGDEDPEREDVFSNSEGNDDFGIDGIDISGFESVLEFIENRIFDKNRSANIYDIKYLRLVWVDPGETLPDINVLCFKYSDVLEVLEDCQWTNKFNDAEHRNMREIFETRLFNSYATNLSGKGILSLKDAQYRQDKMLNFEHNLWSY